MAEQLIIFDTTLRDGEQLPGASMSKNEKLRIAHQPGWLEADIPGTGLAVGSDSDLGAVRRIAQCHSEIDGLLAVAGLARSNPQCR